MKIQEKDYQHGAALTQLVESNDFTALNKASSRYGHYVVNHGRRMFVKYRSTGRSQWQFTFTSDEVKAIASDSRRRNEQTFVVLICGRKSICALSTDELFTVIDRAGRGQQSVTVNLQRVSRCGSTEPLASSATRSRTARSRPKSLPDEETAEGPEASCDVRSGKGCDASAGRPDIIR